MYCYGGQVVSVTTFHANNQSSNLAKVHLISAKIIILYQSKLWTRVLQNPNLSKFIRGKCLLDFKS